METEQEIIERMKKAHAARRAARNDFTQAVEDRTGRQAF